MGNEKVTSGRIEEQFMESMTVGKLKELISDLPDEMTVIIPVIEENDANKIYGFRYVRTAGVLIEPFCGENSFCLNTAAYGVDITTQVKMHNTDYDADVEVRALLF